MKRFSLATFFATLLVLACGKPARNPPILSFERPGENPGTPLEDGGGVLLDDGGVLLPDGGGTLQEDGGVILPDGGGTLQDDGGVLLPDGGGTLEEDGGVILPDGGGVLLEDGGVLLADGGVLLEDGGVVSEDGGSVSGTDAGTPDAGEVPTYVAIKTASTVPTFLTPNTLQIQRQLTGTQPKCTIITLENPTLWVSDGGLTLPSGWGLQNATVKNQACANNGGSTTTSTSVNGTVTFIGATSTFPSSVNVHADAFFTPGGGGFPPADVRFDKDGVPVQ